jgi:hypothetical protein
MSYTISELQIVGVSNTIDLSTIISIPVPCTNSNYFALATSNVVINSIVGSVVTYTPTTAGTFLFVGSITCSQGGALIQVYGTSSVFQATVSRPSDIYRFLPCCNDCYNPIIATDIYEGDTYIPFVLDMEDGTIVTTLSGDQGTVLNGTGVVELSQSVASGNTIQLMVVSDSCKATSTLVTVKAKVEDCESCPSPNQCHIRLLSVSVKHIGINLVSINSLNVEAFGELRYKLDNGAWFSDWASIGSFDSRVNHTLGIKLVNNPSCRIEYPFLAISYT